MPEDHLDTGTGWPEPAFTDESPIADESPITDEPPIADEPPVRDEQTVTDEYLITDEAPVADAEPAGGAEPDTEPDFEPEDMAEPDPDPEPANGARPLPDAVPATAPATGWGLLGGAFRGRRRLSAAGAVIGILLGTLGFALVVQLRSNATDTQLTAARPEDLVRIMSDLDARKDRLRQEIAALQVTKQQLAAGSEGRQAALAEASKRADELGILAGTLPAQGPGLSIEFTPGSAGLKAAVLLDAVEELRGAGAEAMEIDGANHAAVRVVASTYLVDQNSAALSAITVDGKLLTAPYTILAIGDPQTMQTALSIPGGVVDSVNQAAGTVIVNRPGTVRVTALHQVGTQKYAHPAD